MVDFIIRVIIQAIISYIIAAIIYSISVSIANSARKAMQNSLKKRLMELGIDPENPSEEQIKQFLEIDVVKARGQYIVTFKENIYGIFQTQYVTNNKETAIKDLGSRILQFVNVNASALDDDQVGFFMNVWFDTCVKDSLRSREAQLTNSISMESHQISTDTDRINWLKDKIEKNNRKGKVHKNTILNDQLNTLNKSIVECNLKIEAMTEEFEKVKSSIIEPQFVITNEFIGERSKLMPRKVGKKVKVIR